MRDKSFGETGNALLCGLDSELDLRDRVRRAGRTRALAAIVLDRGNRPVQDIQLGSANDASTIAALIDKANARQPSQMERQRGGRYFHIRLNLPHCHARAAKAHKSLKQGETCVVPKFGHDL
jgi:hypothetical protein